MSRRIRARDTSPIDVYILLPKTNCKECGEENCMAFATRLVNHDKSLDKCTLLLRKENEQSHRQLEELVRPAMREITVGIGEKKVKIGGNFVLYRHELKYFNPTALALSITDDMTISRILTKVAIAEEFTYKVSHELPLQSPNNKMQISELKLDMFAIEAKSLDPKTFGKVAAKVSLASELPIILCSFDPASIEVALEQIADTRPLIYAATTNNYKEMAKLADQYNCPLAVFSPGKLRLLRRLTRLLTGYGLKDIVLAPGSPDQQGLSATLRDFTIIRRRACRKEDRLFGFPILGSPTNILNQKSNNPTEFAIWNEACVASMLIARYADLVILRYYEPWALLPVVFLRYDIFNDPRRPIWIEPGLYRFGHPNEDAPVLITSNFSITYHYVVRNISKTGLAIDCYVIVVDTDGLAVDAAVAGRKLTAEIIAEAVRKSGIADKVRHRNLIIPGRAAKLSGELESLSGWKVMVGPRDVEDLLRYLKEKWPFPLTSRTYPFPAHFLHASKYLKDA